jgi:hypothetical protein
MTPGLPPVDPERLLQFIECHEDKNRKQFDHWLKISVSMLTLMSASAVGLFYYFAGRSVEDAKRMATAELSARIEAEFKTERIRQVMKDVVREKTSKELTSALQAEVSRQVAVELNGMKPLIQREVQAGIEQMISSRMQPRRISEGDFKALLKILKERPSANTVYIDIFEPKGSESYKYAEQYLILFQKAGWTSVKIRTVQLEPMRRYTDLVLFARIPTPPPAISWTQPITQMFRDVWKFYLAVFPDSSLTDNEARLVIPPRPL